MGGEWGEYVGYLDGHMKMKFFGRQEVFPLEDNVSNNGKGHGQGGVVRDTPFVPPLIPGWRAITGLEGF